MSRRASTSTVFHITGVSLTVGVGALDFALGHRLGLGLLYMVPIVAAGWWCGRGAAAWYALLAGAEMTTAHVLSATEPIAVAHLVWHSITWLAIFLAAGVLAWLMRAEHVRFSAVRERDEVNAHIDALKVPLDRPDGDASESNHDGPRTGQPPVIDAVAAATSDTATPSDLATPDELVAAPILNGGDPDPASGDQRRRQAEAVGVGLIYLDIENFERLERAFGVPVADALRTGAGETIRRSVRDDDGVITRPSDNAFVVVSRQNDEASLVGMAARVCSEVRLLTSSYPDLDVDVSAGTAFFSAPVEDMRSMIRYADALMSQMRLARKP